MSWINNICDLCGAKVNENGRERFSDRWTPAGKHSSVIAICCSKHSQQEFEDYIDNCYKENPKRDDDLNALESCSNEIILKLLQDKERFKENDS